MTRLTDSIIKEHFMQELATEINKIVDETRSNLHLFTDEQMRSKANPKKWSKIEILGHLIDSAVNNLQRFSEIPFMKDDYIFKSYSQDNLVKHNYYQESDQNQIVDFWSLINHQIAYLIQHIPNESLKLSVSLTDGSSVSLEFLIEDYITHLKHHLQQIFK